MAIQNESTPEWEKTVLEDYASSQTGNDWDKKHKLIFNQNIPIGEDRPASDNVKDLNLQFQSMNPNWKEGISMPIMMKFDLATIKSVIKTNLRRKKRQ